MLNIKVVNWEPLIFGDRVPYLRAWFKCLLVHVVPICLFIYRHFNRSAVQTNDMTPCLTLLTQPEQSFSYDSSISLPSGSREHRILAGTWLVSLAQLTPYSSCFNSSLRGSWDLSIYTGISFTMECLSEGDTGTIRTPSSLATNPVPK